MLFSLFQVASSSGDVRTALNICIKAVTDVTRNQAKTGDFSVLQRVKVPTIVKVMNASPVRSTTELLTNLPLQQKIVVCSVATLFSQRKTLSIANVCRTYFIYHRYMKHIKHLVK